MIETSKDAAIDSLHISDIQWRANNPKPHKEYDNPVSQHDIDKAVHMAAVENSWRSSINGLISAALEDGKDANPNLELLLNTALHQATIFGPLAVEAAGVDFDQYYSPWLPPSVDDVIENGSYATGNRRPL